MPKSLIKEYRNPTRKEIDRFILSYDRDYYKDIIESGVFDLSKDNMAKQFFSHQLKHKRLFFDIKYKRVVENVKLLDEIAWTLVIGGCGTFVVFDIADKLTPDDVNAFVQKLPKFRPIHAINNEIVYGAIAIMKPLKRIVSQAIKSGLFVVTEHDNGIKVINPKGFKPKTF